MQSFITLVSIPNECLIISNDLFDFINGADNADRIGPDRVAQSGLLSEKELARGIIIVFALAVDFLCGCGQSSFLKGIHKEFYAD